MSVIMLSYTDVILMCLGFQTLCSAVTVIQFFFHTALFTWMLVEGINLYIKLVKVFSVKRQYVAYVVIGWGRYTSKYYKKYFLLSHKRQRRKFQFSVDSFARSTSQVLRKFGNSNLPHPIYHILRSSLIRNSSNHSGISSSYKAFHI